MIFIPPPQKRQSGPPVDPRKAAHDTTVGMLVMAAIMLLIALFIFIVGPRSHDPPPRLLGYAMLGFGAVFGIVSFFSWMKEQGDSFGGGADDGQSS
jgi:drug/metabolite transporter (DMT)-like permease